MQRKKQNNKSPLMGIPEELIEELDIRYKEVVSRYKQSDFEHHETSVGKFCEVVMRIFEYIIENKFTAIGEDLDSNKILNKIMASEKGMVDENVKKLVALLIKILFGFRNNRDAAHVGGIDLKQIDTNFTFCATRWIYAELIRAYGDMDINQIQKKIDEQTDIVFPYIIKIKNKKIITNSSLTSEKEVLLSLFDGDKSFEELFEMNKEANVTRFKKKLASMKKKKLIWYSKDENRKNIRHYRLLPEGANLLKL